MKMMKNYHFPARPRAAQARAGKRNNLFFSSFIIIFIIWKIFYFPGRDRARAREPEPESPRAGWKINTIKCLFASAKGLETSLQFFFYQCLGIRVFVYGKKCKSKILKSISQLVEIHNTRLKTHPYYLSRKSLTK